MIRKYVYLFLAVCLLFGAAAVPTNVALAQRPEPPAPEFGLPDGPPEIDFQNPAPAIKKGVELQNSLTPSQHEAVRQILDSHLPEVKAIYDALAATGRTSTPQPLDKSITARMWALVDAIDADMATVLDADQLALYRAVVNPDLDGLGPLNNPADAPKPLGINDYTEYCWYCAYYDAYAKYYSYYGYLYGYYDYYYYGGDYSYYAWNYAYYGYLYARYALDYSGATYFSYYYFGMYSTDYPYYAYEYSYYSYYYMYYAEQYAYYNYYYYGGTYAYYGWAYDYYGLYGAEYAYIYAYYCYYYA
jgi:hypothetical protein